MNKIKIPVTIQQNTKGQFTLTIPKLVSNSDDRIKKGIVTEVELTDQGLLYKFPIKEDN